MRHLEPTCVLAGAVLSGISVTLVKFRGCSRQQLELSLLGGCLQASHSPGFLHSF